MCACFSPISVEFTFPNGILPSEHVSQALFTYCNLYKEFLFLLAV